MKKIVFCITLPLIAIGILCSCQTAYYGAMEKIGVHKRDILLDRVESARDSQAEAKEQFKDALEQFGAVVHFKGGELEAKYKKLSGEFDECSTRAEEVRTRIAKVESVAKALFKEWKAELDQYTNRDLRRSSEKRMVETKKKYGQMIATMQKAANTMAPVLNAFRDQVLFLKHNLNARAIASIQKEAEHVEADVGRLIRDMEASIAEADAFIRELGVP